MKTNLLLFLVITLLALGSSRSAAGERPLDEKSKLLGKLELKIPDIKLNNATLEETIMFLRLRSLELDPAVENKGINFVISQVNDDHQISDKIIDHLDARNLSILEILNLVCLKTKTQYQLDDYAVVLLPILDETGKGTQKGEPFIQRKWSTPPNFLSYITPPAAGLTRIETQRLLETLGVPFPANSAASFLLNSSTLVVRNTPANLHLVDAIVKASGDPEGALKERKNLEKIIIPQLTFESTTLEEAVDFLRIRSLELDPAKKGINLNVVGDEKLSGRIIKTLNLKKVPITTALRYICSATQTQPHFQGRNIIILPKN